MHGPPPPGVGKRSLNVLVLNWRDPSNPRGGGAEKHVWEIMTRAVTWGWNVTLLCCSHNNAQRDEMIDGIRVVRRGGEFTIYGCWPFAFRRLAREVRPDVVVEFLNKLPFFAPLHTRIPVLCFVHHLFGSAAHLEFPRPLAWLVKTGEALIPWMYRQNTFLAGAESTCAELAGLGVPKEHIHAVPYGVDVHAYRPGAKCETPRMIFVGRLKKYKGLGDLLVAVARLRRQFPELRLDIVGQGDARSSLEAKTRSLGLHDAVTFHGFVDEAKKFGLYQQAWVACLPSAKEGFGLTIPEAALCEVPTVGYDVCGVRDAIQDGVTGILVPWGDVNSLTKACAHLLEEREPRLTMGRAARDRYQAFTWDDAAEAVRSFIEREFSVRSDMRCATPDESDLRDGQIEKVNRGRAKDEHG